MTLKVPDDLFAGVMIGGNKMKSEPYLWQALLPNGQTCVLDSYPVGPRYALDSGLVFHPENHHLYHCFGYLERIAGVKQPRQGFIGTIEHVS